MRSCFQCPAKRCATFFVFVFLVHSLVFLGAHVTHLRRDFDRPGSVWFGLVRNRSDFDSSGSVNRKRVYGSV